MQKQQLEPPLIHFDLTCPVQQKYPSTVHPSDVDKDSTSNQLVHPLLHGIMDPTHSQGTIQINNIELHGNRPTTINSSLGTAISQSTQLTLHNCNQKGDFVSFFTCFHLFLSLLLPLNRGSEPLCAGAGSLAGTWADLHQ